jgi:hypothetical protein
VNASALASNGGLIFHWEPPRRRQLAIAGFLVASIIGHAFCFYIFQIIYPPTVSLLPPPARIHVIAPNSEEGRTLLRWIEAEDPALASITQRPPDAKGVALPKLEHLPSYLSTQPALKELPPEIPDLRVPSSQPPAPAPIARTRKVPATFAVRTSVTFSSELAALGAWQRPEMKWSASTHEPPQSAQFRVAVTNRGLLRYCFLESSSGDTALDEQAKKYLALCRFTGSARSDFTAEDRLIWAIATIEWGNDVAFPSSSISEAPAP